MSKPSLFRLVASHFQEVGVQPSSAREAPNVLRNHLISGRYFDHLTGFWDSVCVPHEGRLALCADAQDALGSPAPGDADLKDLLGFLASGKTAASREAQGDASRLLGLPHTVWLGDPKKRCDGIGADRQADVLEPEGLGGLKLEGKRGVKRQASSA